MTLVVCGACGTAVSGKDCFGGDGGGNVPAAALIAAAAFSAFALAGVVSAVARSVVFGRTGR